MALHSHNVPNAIVQASKPAMHSTKNTNLMGGGSATHAGMPKTAPKAKSPAGVKSVAKTRGGTN